MINRLAVPLAAFTLSLLACSAACAAPPPAAQGAICRPVFQADGQTYSAGTAFVVDLPKPDSRTLLVSAIHLFGPDGGLEQQIPAAELAQRVSLVACQPLDSAEAWQGGRALTIPGALPMGEGPLKDVAAFVLDTKSAATLPARLKLAATPPKPGETVWLLAQVLEGAPVTQLLHRAVVRSSKDEGLQYEYENASLKLMATSGAPVLNADGEVVGINLGGGTLRGKLIGVGGSVTSMRSLLSSAK